MSPTTTLLPLPEVPADVLGFAEEKGAAAYLPAVVAMTRRIFPTDPLTVFVEDDPEIAEDRHIIVEVRVPADTDAEEFVRTHQQWSAEIFRHCPAPHVCVFRLGVTPSA